MREKRDCLKEQIAAITSIAFPRESARLSNYSACSIVRHQINLSAAPT